MKYSSEFRTMCGNELEKLIQELPALMDGSQVRIPAKQRFGGRVWFLPAWLLSAHIRCDADVTTWARVLRGTIGFPELDKVASIVGPCDESSGVRWSWGKGLVGKGALESTECEIVRHDNYWPENLEHMTRRQWRDWSGDNPEQAQNRSLSDARSLKALYGTALGCRLFVPANDGTEIAAGCITVHTSAGDYISPEDEVKCHRRVEYRARYVSGELPSWFENRSKAFRGRYAFGV